MTVVCSQAWCCCRWGRSGTAVGWRAAAPEEGPAAKPSCGEGLRGGTVWGGRAPLPAAVAAVPGSGHHWNR